MASTGKAKTAAAAKPATKTTAKAVSKTTAAAKPVAQPAPKAAPTSSRQAKVGPAPATPVKYASAPRATPAAPPKAIVLTMNAHKKYGDLTEAEIMKQSEDDYMSKAQLAFFKEKLTELRSTILVNATDTGEHLREAEVATDPSDRATQEEEYTLELRTRDRERKLLRKVDKALRMIDDGSFGWCEETGEPIGLARLIARPTATLSIEAQERRERMQKLFGD
jgi:DnaK suppressor protein